MSRRQANIYLSIWNDPDFLTLSPNAKLLYFVLLTHPTLTYCGVADWREKRLATMAGGLTIEALRDAAWELGQKRMIAVDPDTEEVLVRSFVRHDGGLKQPNTAKGMAREYGTIMSLEIRELVTLETRRAVAENPDWKGNGEVTSVTKQFPDSTGGPSVLVPEAFRLGSVDPSGNPSIDPSGNPSVDPLNTSTSTSTSTYVESVGASDEAATTQKQKRGTRISEDFTVTDHMRAWAANKAPLVDVDRATEKFINHWASKTGQSATKLDWNRTWQNWLITDQERAESRTQYGSAPKLDRATQTYLADAARYEAAEQNQGVIQLAIGQ